MTTTPQTTPSTTKVIDERQDAAAQYRIITADEDIIHRTAEQLARASKMQMTAEVWADNFWSMVEHVQGWAEQRKARLQQVVVEFRSDKVVFGIIPACDEYDFDLGFEQAELDTYMNTRGNIGYVETRQVPRWDVTTFVCPSAWRVWPAE